MADTNLYKVLSGLYTTDSKLWTKIQNLSGAVSDAFGSDAFVVVGKENGITASTLKLGADADTTLSASGTLATEAAVKAYVDAKEAAQGSALTGVIGSNTIDVTDGTKNVTLAVITDGKTITSDANGLKTGLSIKKLTTATDGYAASYQLQDLSGNAFGDTINIFKDQFLSGAHYDSVNEEIVLDFVIANPAGTDTAAQVKINAHDLVHELSGSNAISVTDVKNGQSEISLKLDTSTTGTESGDGKFLSITSNGLLLSGVQDAITTAVNAASTDANAGLTTLSAALADYLSGNAVKNQFAADDARLDALETKTGETITAGNLVEFADGKYADAGVAAGSDSTVSSNFGSDTTLATEKAAKAYVDGKFDIAQATADTKIAKIGNNGTNEHVVIFDGNGDAVKDSGKTVGASNTAADAFGTANTLADEAAVKTFVEYKLAGTGELLSQIEALQADIG